MKTQKHKTWKQIKIDKKFEIITFGFIKWVID